ncbi:MAG: archaellar assembly protein FlaJ [Thermoplasmatales archaeon]|nr:MAG: archaellar assembly protein FlaJ [Thermoplasmatales archaeon]
MNEEKGILKRFKIISKKKKKKGRIKKEFRIAYKSVESPENYFKKILFPLIILGSLVFFLPSILDIFSIPLAVIPVLFPFGGIIIIILGVLHPYITWKNKEVEINESMHFFITHLRVLAISDLGLKDIINVVGGKKVYGYLGEEIRKIAKLSTTWKVSMENAFRFISERTPSKILKDFLDRFNQSVSSGVNHRDFVEQEQGGVMEEYITMYESSNEVITLLNEIYVALLTAIGFLMVFGIIAPAIAGGDLGTYFYVSCFVFIISEVFLLYFVHSFVPKDELWHTTGKKSYEEKKVDNVFRLSVFSVISIGGILLFTKYVLAISFLQNISFEILVAISLTPLIIPGIMMLLEEEKISRREKNFMGFLPSLGSIATMRGGKIRESVYYLSRRDYGILSENIGRLSKRLKTRIDDSTSWEWFGVETHSNLIQRFSEIFREATFAAANPRLTSNMIVENMRKIKNLRFKKLTILKTGNALFYAITLGLTLTIYVTLVISRHMNNITQAAGDPFKAVGVQMPILRAISEEAISNAFIIVFFVLLIHCFIIAFTIKVLRGGHKYITLFHFVLLVWIVAIIGTGINIGLTEFLGM